RRPGGPLSARGATRHQPPKTAALPFSWSGPGGLLTGSRAPHYLSRDSPTPDRTPRESRPIRSHALLVLSAAVLATAVRAAGSPPPSSAESLLEMWAAPGLPGFVSDLHMHNGLPWSYMGLVAGAVTVRDGLLPSTGPWPGISEIAAPRSWYDSAAVVVGEGG